MRRHRFARGLTTAALAVAPACTSPEPAAPDDAGAPPPPPTASSTATEPARPSAAPPPSSCFRRGQAMCNPVSGAGCLGGERCDFSETEAELTLACTQESSGTLEVGARCTANGAPCARGSRCAEGVCRAFCCTGSDCTVSGETCLPFDDRMGTLGVCAIKPACVKAGESCKRSGDCCSNDCHVGHCH
ncbi:MAG: hypothetical protein U0183_07240 [Polyangiaceae bacterium]